MRGRRAFIVTGMVSSMLSGSARIGFGERLAVQRLRVTREDRIQAPRDKKVTQKFSNSYVLSKMEILYTRLVSQLQMANIADAETRALWYAKLSGGCTSRRVLCCPRRRYFDYTQKNRALLCDARTRDKMRGSMGRHNQACGVICNMGMRALLVRERW